MVMVRVHTIRLIQAGYLSENNVIMLVHFATGSTESLDLDAC